MIKFQRRKGAKWEHWTETMTPKPPKPEDAPFYPTHKPGSAQWPTTGVHFFAMNFDGRIWDAEKGWN